MEINMQPWEQDAAISREHARWLEPDEPNDDEECDDLYNVSVIVAGALDDEESCKYIEDAEELMDAYIESVIKDYRDGVIDRDTECEVSVYDTFENQNVRNWKSIDHMDEIFGEEKSP